MEKIDLNKLTQRELLIITHNKVADLSERFSNIETDQDNQRERLVAVETTVKTRGGIWGAIAGAIIAAISSIIKLGTS
ncbi:MAG: hypothetical protein JXQ80_12905 [Bacteroidales bacterium]|nr:hypothetical protein [Bacteroidales bacterium]